MDAWRLFAIARGRIAKTSVLGGGRERSQTNKLPGGAALSDPQVILDVQQFSPDEITVKTVDNHVVVEAKHEEKQDEHGYISRHFVRRYVLPPSHDLVNITSTLSSDGVLTITAPKKVRSIEPRQSALTSASLPHSRTAGTANERSLSLSPSIFFSRSFALSPLSRLCYSWCGLRYIFDFCFSIPTFPMLRLSVQY